MIAYFCQLHDCIIRERDYHSHMDLLHEGRNDCIGGIRSIAQVEAILGGATYTEACCQRATVAELLDRAAGMAAADAEADGVRSTKVRVASRFRTLYENEYGVRLTASEIINTMRAAGLLGN